MRGYLAGLPLVLCACLACACSPRLAKQTAYDELVKRHVPELENLYLVDIADNSVLGNNIKDLINNNYFLKSESMTAYDLYYIPGYKDRRAGTVSHHHINKYFKINVPVARTKIGEVVEIIDDPANNMATVLYTVVKEPLEPYYSKLCIDSACGNYGDGIRQKTRKNMYFKFQNDEWKIDR